jgi:hypothetical protein
MRKLGLVLLLLLPLGCAPSGSDTPDSSPGAPADTNDTSAAVQTLDDATTVEVAIAVPGMT